MYCLIRLFTYLLVYVLTNLIHRTISFLIELCYRFLYFLNKRFSSLSLILIDQFRIIFWFLFFAMDRILLLVLLTWLGQQGIIRGFLWRKNTFIQTLSPRWKYIWASYLLLFINVSLHRFLFSKIRVFTINYRSAVRVTFFFINKCSIMSLKLQLWVVFRFIENF